MSDAQGADGWRAIETWTPNDMSVLVTDGVEVWKAEQVDGVWLREDAWSGEPTHWMPLPKIPQGT